MKFFFLKENQAITVRNTILINGKFVEVWRKMLQGIEGGEEEKENTNEDIGTVE